MSGGHAARWVGIAAALAVLSSCAYYNTYYLARKYYMAATDGLPYPVDKTQPGQAGNFQKAADLSKKVVVEYSKSKWADDAYLLWARALLGKEDPLQTIIMLQDFERRFPASALRNESTFYLGVAMRQARKYREALVPLDEFIAKAPRHDLIPYAHLERARALMALQEPGAAAAAAGQVIDRYPNSVLVDQARAIRAEGLLAGGDPARARADFQALGADARTDDDRFEFLLREADCLESARDYGSELALLNDAIAHQVAPPPVLPGQPMVITAGSGADRYGRLELRIGTAKLLSGKNDEALADFKHVLVEYPKTVLSAEAQYRIGFAYETVLDDFELARQEYLKVHDESSGSAFSAQATQRLASLDRLAKYRSAGTDSLGRRTEAGFLLAEQYLFQLGKPERALDAYKTIADEHPGTDAAAKAIVAEAWVLRRKLDRAGDADSLLWRVVHEYPATEAQLAARDYLEAAGQAVPVDLIRLPERFAAADSDSIARGIGDLPGAALVAIDTTQQRLGTPHGVYGAMLTGSGFVDSSARANPRHEITPPSAFSSQAPAAPPPFATSSPPASPQPEPSPPASAQPAPIVPSRSAGAVPSESPDGGPPMPQQPQQPKPSKAAAPASRDPRGGSPLDDPPRPGGGT